MMILMSALALLVQPADGAKSDPVQTEAAAAAISEPSSEQALEEAAAKPQSEAAEEGADIVMTGGGMTRFVVSIPFLPSSHGGCEADSRGTSTILSTGELRSPGQAG